MKTISVAFLFLISILTGCSAQKISVNEMIISDPAYFTKLNNTHISVSTKDSVKVEIRNSETSKVYKQKRLLQDKAITNYNFKSDSLFINDPYYHSIIGLNAISSVKFKGVYDNELGFVSENEINDNIPMKIKWGRGVTWSLMGAGAGLIVGGITGLIVGKTRESGFMSGFDPIGNFLTGALIGGAIGAVTGGIWGSNNTDAPPDLQQVLNEIRENRRNKD